MRKIRIAIAPELTDRYGSEIHWIWRLLLTHIGWLWEEVSTDDVCDVAYVVHPADAPSAALCLCADPAAWARPAACHLKSINRNNGLPYPQFEGQTPLQDLLQSREGRLVCWRDIVFDVFWLVTGQQERHFPQNEHGFFDLSEAPAWREQVLRQAPASQVAIWLQETLPDKGDGSPVPPWPQGKRAVAAIGHDVDYPEVKRLLEPLRIVAHHGRAGLGPALDVLAGRRTHWHFANWVRAEQELQTRSAFYFVARQGSLLEYATGTPDPFYDVTSERFRRLFDYLAQEGFEIGLHASYAAYKSRERMAAEKQKLEQASGQKIVGGRHHYWHLDPQNVEATLLMHEQIGLNYDTSLIHNNYLGWRRGMSGPFFPFHQAQRRELETLQIPTAWMDDQLFGLNAYNPGNRMETLHAIVDRTAEQGGCLLIDVHDYVFDDVLFPDWAGTYLRLWKELLDRGDFWFATPAEIAEHWTKRYNRLVQNSIGLNQGIT